MGFQKTGHAPALGEGFRVTAEPAKDEAEKPKPCEECGEACDIRGVCSSCGHANSRL